MPDEAWRREPWWVMSMLLWWLRRLHRAIARVIRRRRMRRAVARVISQDPGPITVVQRWSSGWSSWNAASLNVRYPPNRYLPWWAARLLDLAAWLDRGVWTRLGYDAEFWLAEAICLPRTDAYLRYNEVYLAASTNSPVAGEYRRIWPDNKTCVVWDGWTPGRYV